MGAAGWDRAGTQLQLEGGGRVTYVFLLFAWSRVSLWRVPGRAARITRNKCVLTSGAPSLATPVGV